MVFGLTADATWQAFDVERRHSVAVRQAIRDDASVVADDLERRLIFEFEEFVSRPLRSAAVDYLDRRPAGTIDDLRKATVPPLGDATDLAKEFFVLDFRKGTVSPLASAPLVRWVLKGLPAAVEKRRLKGGTPTVRVHLADGDHLLIYGTAFFTSGRIFGFTIDDAHLGTLAARAWGRRSPYPGNLGGGKLTRNDVFIRISRDGRELFRTPGEWSAERGIEHRIPSAYGEAIGGATMQCSFSAAAAPSLLVGGVPETRLPLLIATLLASAAALAAAIYVMQRERHSALMRADFVSGVSHELRTPLTQIRMFSETLLLDRIRSEDERRRSLQIINDEARRLTHLVDNVLFVSRGEESGLDFVREECDLELLIAECADAFAPLAARRSCVLVVDASPGLVARVDPEAWKQVLTNLLDNAVKYGPEGQTVRVTASAAGGVLRLTVDDEGPGIPTAEREAVWRRYVRLPPDRAAGRSGSGIGLSIVREIVTRHGGRCSVCDSPSGGARFLIEVPTSAPHPFLGQPEASA